MPRPIPLTLRHELIGLGGVVERNRYLVKRYAWWELTFFFWTVANTLTIVGSDFGATPVVTLAGRPLSVTSATNTQIVASLPASIAPATYMLVVSRGSAAGESNSLPVTISTAGSAGQPGPTGATGPAGSQPTRC